MRFIDTHAHLDFNEFDGERAKLIKQMELLGIEQTIIPAASPLHWNRLLQVATKYQLPFALGIHPWFCSHDGHPPLQKILSDNLSHKLVAIGESGLDKVHIHSWQQQLETIKLQLTLAKELQLPIILHVVRAHQEMLTLLKYYQLNRGGVIHGFTGSFELACEYTKLGFSLGVGSQLLNIRAKKLRNCISKLPVAFLVSETDSPTNLSSNWLKNTPTPLILPQIVQEVAKLQKKSTVLISEQLFFNATQLFDL